MSQLAYEQRHKKLVANSKALDNLLTDATLIMASPLLIELAPFFSFTKASLISGSVNATANFTGQYVGNGENLEKVDYFGVGTSFVGGYFKSPWLGKLISTSLDVGIDVYGNGEVRTINQKTSSVILSDLLFTSISNYVPSKFLKKYNNSLWEGIINLYSTESNTVINEQIENK